MNYRKKIVIILPLLILISLYIYIEKFFTSIGTFIFSFSSVLVLILLMLLFVRNYVFNSWIKFAKFYLPVSAILVFITPNSSGDVIDFDKELSALWLAGIFLISSIGIIIFKSFKKQ